MSTYIKRSDLMESLIDGLDLESPLEKFWSACSDKWWPERPDSKVKIKALGDIVVDDKATLCGQYIKCPLCGRDDNWDVEGDYRTREIKVFVCEHQTKDLEKIGLVHWLPCRVVSTIRADMVWEFEEV